MNLSDNYVFASSILIPGAINSLMGAASAQAVVWLLRYPPVNQVTEDILTGGLRGCHPVSEFG